ncbi:MAG: hypothetical protein M3295_10195 [Chloroflexota bacterium]|nr:hypothetical protein [Chloroflexota bacterium]
MRIARATATLAGIALAAALAAAPSVAAARTAERQLAERYAPILMLKVNDDPPCSRSGEQYFPARVEITLGNRDVKLVRGAARGGEGGEVLKNAPVARDLAGLGLDYYLDQPGDPHRPRCTYARASQALTRGRPAVTYAHIVREPSVRGIALQYWFYYWFNHFNDLHESDWEGIQLVFPAPTAREALRRAPSQIAYAQHGGGERADWDDPKVEKRGDHPVVYVSSGSHASQFDSAIYLGNGRRGSGLGCDDTTRPSRAVRPRPILVATFPAATSRDAWLQYRGHWGQQAKGFFNGITGPNTKERWLEPVRWMGRLRASTPELPAAEPFGVTVTGFFCGAVSAVTDFLNFTGGAQQALLLLLLVLGVAVAVPARFTRWTAVEPLPLRRERAAGQVLRAGIALYRRYALTLVPVGLVSVGFGFAAAWLQEFLFDETGLRAVTNIATADINSVLALVIGVPAYPLALALAGAPVVSALGLVDAGRRVSVWSAIREVAPRLPRLLVVQLGTILIVLLLALTVIGIPLAVKKAVDWTFVPQEVILDARSMRAAPRASTRRAAGRWWTIAAINAGLFLLGAVLGPLAGSLLILFTNASLSTVNIFGLLVFGLVVPYMAIVWTLLYLDPRTPRAASSRVRRG